MAKKIIIIGASSGIGLSMAEHYLADGCRVGLAARKTAALEELVRQYPQQAVVKSIDINDADAPQKLNELADAVGGMDLYVHVAGIGYDNPGLDPEREAQILATNACGFARMLSAAYGYYKSRNIRGGQIAAITSVAGTKGMGLMSAYSASKKCAQTYMVALEQLAHGEGADIDFTDIRPGWIRTPLLHDGRRYPLEMTLEYAAPLIIKAINKRKRVAVIDWRWNVIVGLWRLIPNALWRRFPLKTGV